MTTKIAFPTDDNKTISRHFGQAAQFLVLTVDDGRVVDRETRAKPAHSHDHDHDHDHAAPDAVALGSIGVSAPEQGREHGRGHQAMFDLLADCQVLVAGGMGQPAYDRATAVGLEVLLPGEKEIERALAAYLAGDLTSDMRRVHEHGHSH